jgi:DNA-binding transcriptional LysR family regulator
LAAFRKQHPGLLFTLTVAEPDGVLALLAARQADLGWLFALGRPAGCTVHHESAAPMVALVRPDHPLAARRRVGVAEVAQYPLLLGSPGTTARRLFDQACAARGLKPQAVVTANTLGPLLALLGPQDVGVAARVSVGQALAQGHLVALPFGRGQLPARRVQVLSPRGTVLSPLASALASALGQALEITDTTAR